MVSRSDRVERGGWTRESGIIPSRPALVRLEESRLFDSPTLGDRVVANHSDISPRGLVSNERFASRTA